MFGEKSWSFYLISGIVVQGQWCRYEYTIPLFNEYYMRYGPRLTGVTHPTEHTMTSNYTPDMISCYQDVGPKRKIHPPHQWYRCPMTVIYFWVCYPSILWVLYEAWATSDRGGSPHILLNDLQLHSWHHQLLTWFLVPRAWTMHLISYIVVQGWWYMYVYAPPLFYECYMRHGSRMTGVGHFT